MTLPLRLVDMGLYPNCSQQTVRFTRGLLVHEDVTRVESYHRFERLGMPLEHGVWCAFLLFRSPKKFHLLVNNFGNTNSNPSTNRQTEAGQHKPRQKLDVRATFPDRRHCQLQRLVANSDTPSLPTVCKPTLAPFIAVPRGATPHHSRLGPARPRGQRSRETRQHVERPLALPSVCITSGGYTPRRQLALPLHSSLLRSPQTALCRWQWVMIRCGNVCLCLAPGCI